MMDTEPYSLTSQHVVIVVVLLVLCCQLVGRVQTFLMLLHPPASLCHIRIVLLRLRARRLWLRRLETTGSRDGHTQTPGHRSDQAIYLSVVTALSSAFS